LELHNYFGPTPVGKKKRESITFARGKVLHPLRKSGIGKEKYQMSWEIMSLTLLCPIRISRKRTKATIEAMGSEIRNPKRREKRREEKKGQQPGKAPVQFLLFSNAIEGKGEICPSTVRYDRRGKKGSLIPSPSTGRGDHMGKVLKTRIAGKSIPSSITGKRETLPKKKKKKKRFLGGEKRGWGEHFPWSQQHRERATHEILQRAAGNSKGISRIGARGGDRLREAGKKVKRGHSQHFFPKWQGRRSRECGQKSVSLPKGGGKGGKGAGVEHNAI